MRIIARKTLKVFWEHKNHRDSEQALRAWFAEAKKASWEKPQDIKNDYGNASFVGTERVVFNIAGNKYRLVVAVNYDFRILFIRFIGTHKEYDMIDVEEI